VLFCLFLYLVNKAMFLWLVYFLMVKVGADAFLGLFWWCLCRRMCIWGGNLGVVGLCSELSIFFVCCVGVSVFFRCVAAG